MKRNRRWFVLALTLVAGLAVAQTTLPKIPSLYKTSKLSPGTVGISCKNGSDPQVGQSGVKGIILVTCQ